jgi:hypothetical protein
MVLRKNIDNKCTREVHSIYMIFFISIPVFYGTGNILQKFLTLSLNVENVAFLGHPLPREPKSVTQVLW